MVVQYVPYGFRSGGQGTDKTWWPHWVYSETGHIGRTQSHALKTLLLRLEYLPSLKSHHFHHFSELRSEISENDDASSSEDIPAGVAELFEDASYKFGPPPAMRKSCENAMGTTRNYREPCENHSKDKTFYCLIIFFKKRISFKWDLKCSLKRLIET